LAGRCDACADCVSDATVAQNPGLWSPPALGCSLVAHPLGDEFPREGFVQAALEADFASCEQIESRTVDFVCFDPEAGIRWIIEAKGETSSTGLDFRTGLGQIMTAMSDQKANYALAMPDTPRFERLRSQIAPWVRQHLNLYWLIVTPSGEVEAEAPPP
jgi:hypothetical protein